MKYNSYRLVAVFELLVGFRHRLVLFSNLKQNIGVSEKFLSISAPKETSFCPVQQKKSLCCEPSLFVTSVTDAFYTKHHERENFRDPGKSHTSLLLMGIRYQHIS